MARKRSASNSSESSSTNPDRGGDATTTSLPKKVEARSRRARKSTQMDDAGTDLKRSQSTNAKTANVPPIDTDSLPSTQTRATLNKKRKQLHEWLTPPFPEFKTPESKVYQDVQDALYKLHPKTPLVTGPVGYDGEPTPDGELPDVLHTMIRIILSQNTNTTNENRANVALTERFGEGNYLAMHRATQEEVIDTLKVADLANVKGKAIKSILADTALQQVKREGLKSEDNLDKLSLQYIHTLSDEAALEALVSFSRVGPKTAGGLSMFCLGRDSFAVDTHILRITKSLGWTPEEADADTATRHLNATIPKANKKPLHFLLIRHGQACHKCAAGGRLVPGRFDPDIEVAEGDCPIRRFYKTSGQQMLIDQDARTLNPSSLWQSAHVRLIGVFEIEIPYIADIGLPCA